MFLATSLLAISLQAQIERPPYMSTQDVPWSKTGHPLNGMYKLYWDDKIDGSLVFQDSSLIPPAAGSPVKSCDIRIKVQNGKVTGEFVGPIMGREHRAIIQGRIDGGQDPINVMSFRQVEKDYICSYQIVFGMGSFEGVWHDTVGRSGDFRLLKYQ